MTNTYKIQYDKKAPIILYLLEREGLQFVQTLNDEEKEKNVNPALSCVKY